ncbi:hypothetical protein [Nonlabens ponticola]|uniref:Uncharacterized protein n=1 Tax=Nonlabens ponticola TaxID=2496866 RepID=A0A3S9MYJ2_9FLAO|nr:hypothetical protein [Nonlabens ponticola]AZQ44250.1 hypothetical protein EJ995_08375 [Nonlabens ponticola]
MKNLTLLLLLMGCLQLSAQAYVEPYADQEISQEAKNLALEFDQELSLTERQLMLTERKNEEFIKRYQEVIDDDSIDVSLKNNLLSDLYREQGREMADILTRPQLLVYSRIRDELQPLIVIR